MDLVSSALRGRNSGPSNVASPSRVRQIAQNVVSQPKGNWLYRGLKSAAEAFVSPGAGGWGFKPLALGSAGKETMRNAARQISFA